MPGHPKTSSKTSSALNEHFYIACASQFAEQAGSCIFPNPQFIMLYTNIYVYVHTNCKCDSISCLTSWLCLQTSYEKCRRKLTVMIFSWGSIPFEWCHEHNCRIWGSQPPQEFVKHQWNMPKVKV